MFLVFKVLYLCANVHSGGCQSATASSMPLLPDLQLECDVEPLPERLCEWTLGAAAATGASSKMQQQTETDSLQVIRLVARTAIAHLVNHLGHFPKGFNGAARLNSAVQEYNDLDIELNDLRQELFEEPNIQFFVLNNSILLSFVELCNSGPVPTAASTGCQADVACSTATTMARIIVRDVAGKFCWDTATLYGSRIATCHSIGLESNLATTLQPGVLVEPRELRGSLHVFEQQSYDNVSSTSGLPNLDQPPTPPPRAAERLQNQQQRRRSASISWVQFSPESESEPQPLGVATAAADCLDEVSLYCLSV